MTGRRHHVITGASGAGKSTLVAALGELGYATVPEAGLAVMREQQACGNGILPWTDRAAFMEAVLARSIRDHETAMSLAAPVFFDRAVPEWLRFLGTDATPDLVAAATRCRYAGTVFVAEPWPEIYVRDDERRASFERAARSYQSTVSAYVEAGYRTCVIPRAPVPERVAFVLARIEPGD